MKEFDLPAELPASLSDQLKALAPYLRNFELKANGGFVLEYSVPHALVTDLIKDTLTNME